MAENLIVAPTQEQIDLARGYRVGKWGKHVNYECVECQYSTLWIERMQKHIAQGEHAWAYPVPISDELSKYEGGEELEY